MRTIWASIWCSAVALVAMLGLAAVAYGCDGHEGFKCEVIYVQQGTGVMKTVTICK